MTKKILFNRLDRRFSQSYIESVLRKNNLSYVLNVTAIDVGPNYVRRLIMSSIFADKHLTSAQKKGFSYDLNFMLLTCNYNEEPCNSSDFTW
jgi:hypothetical protein